MHLIFFFQWLKKDDTYATFPSIPPSTNPTAANMQRIKTLLIKKKDDYQLTKYIEQKVIFL